MLELEIYISDNLLSIHYLKFYLGTIDSFQSSTHRATPAPPKVVNRWQILFWWGVTRL